MLGKSMRDDAIYSRYAGVPVTSISPPFVMPETADQFRARMPGIISMMSGNDLKIQYDGKKAIEIIIKSGYLGELTGSQLADYAAPLPDNEAIRDLSGKKPAPYINVLADLIPAAQWKHLTLDTAAYQPQGPAGPTMLDYLDPDNAHGKDVRPAVQ